MNVNEDRLVSREIKFRLYYLMAVITFLLTVVLKALFTNNVETVFFLFDCEDLGGVWRTACAHGCQCPCLAASGLPLRTPCRWRDVRRAPAAGNSPSPAVLLGMLGTQTLPGGLPPPY